MSKYDINRLQGPAPSGRNSGKTVRALFDAIGILMTTQDETVYYVVNEQHYERHISRTFYDIVTDHFEEIPVIINDKLGIKGYSSKLKIVTMDYDSRGKHMLNVVYDTRLY